MIYHDISIQANLNHLCQLYHIHYFGYVHVIPRSSTEIIDFNHGNSRIHHLRSKFHQVAGWTEDENPSLLRNPRSATAPPTEPWEGQGVGITMVPWYSNGDF